jgi:ATP synthase I subunit
VTTGTKTAAMTPARFLTHVTIDSTIALLALALPAVWLGGPAAGLGLLTGVALGLGNLWWLAGGALALSRGETKRRGWSRAAAGRFAAFAAVLVLVLTTGLAHPVALVVGLTVLPCALVTEGLRRAAWTE